MLATLLWTSVAPGIALAQVCGGRMGEGETRSYVSVTRDLGVADSGRQMAATGIALKHRTGWLGMASEAVRVAPVAGDSVDRAATVTGPTPDAYFAEATAALGFPFTAAATDAPARWCIWLGATVSGRYHPAAGLLTDRVVAVPLSVVAGYELRPTTWVVITPYLRPAVALAIVEASNGTPRDSTRAAPPGWGTAHVFGSVEGGVRTLVGPVGVAAGVSQSQIPGDQWQRVLLRAVLEF